MALFANNIYSFREKGNEKLTMCHLKTFTLTFFIVLRKNLIENEISPKRSAGKNVLKNSFMYK